MKRIHWLIVAAALVVTGAVLFAPGGVFAGTKVGVPQFPSGIAVGDNYAEDTLWVMGHIKIDSSGSYATMTLNGTTTISDSLYVPATAGAFWGKGSKIYADSSLIFSFSGTKGRLKVLGAVLGVDSMRVVKKFVAEDGAVATLDTVAITDGQYWPKGTPIFGDSVIFFKKTRIDADSMAIGLKLLCRDNSTALLDSVRVDDGTSFAANSKIWGTNTLVFKSMRPVMDSVTVGSKIRASQDATIYGANTLVLNGARISVDSASLGTKIRLGANANIYGNTKTTFGGAALWLDTMHVQQKAVFPKSAQIVADSLLIFTGGRAQFDTIAVNNILAKGGKGPGDAVNMADIRLTADTIFADTIGVGKVNVKTTLNCSGTFLVNSLPSVFPINVAFDDDSIADEGPHLSMVCPKALAVRYVIVDLSEAIATEACTLVVSSPTDSAKFKLHVGTDDTTMTCEMDVAAGAVLSVTSRPATGSKDGAALGADAPDCVLWVENK